MASRFAITFLLVALVYGHQDDNDGNKCESTSLIQGSKRGEIALTTARDLRAEGVQLALSQGFHIVDQVDHETTEEEAAAEAAEAADDDPPAVHSEAQVDAKTFVQVLATNAGSFQGKYTRFPSSLLEDGKTSNNKPFKMKVWGLTSSALLQSDDNAKKSNDGCCKKANGRCISRRFKHAGTAEDVQSRLLKLAAKCLAEAHNTLLLDQKSQTEGRDQHRDFISTMTFLAN